MKNNQIVGYAALTFLFLVLSIAGIFIWYAPYPNNIVLLLLLTYFSSVIGVRSAFILGKDVEIYNPTIISMFVLGYSAGMGITIYPTLPIIILKGRVFH